MRPAHRLLLLGLAIGLIGCVGDVPAPAPPVTEPEQPAEQFVAAPIPRKDARPKRAFGPPSSYPKSPDAFRAMEVLDAALVRVWEQDDPREDAADLVRAVGITNGAAVIERARATAAKLQKLDLPAQRRVAWERFATAVAPWDIELRDEFLWLAIADGQRALKVDAIWQPEVFSPGVVPRGNPQKMREFEKQSLEYSVRLWKVVLEYARDRESGLDQAIALFEDARGRGYVTLGCLIRGYIYGITEQLADFDPGLLIALLPKVIDEETAAYLCGSRAYRRWQDGQRDGITGTLAKRAFDARAKGHWNELAPFYDPALEREQVLADRERRNNPAFTGRHQLLKRADAHPDALRVLANPKDISWLTDADRYTRLHQAAELAYPDADKPEVFWEIIALLPAPRTAEEREMPYGISNAAHHGMVVDAIYSLRHVKSPRYYCQVAVRVAFELSGRDR